MNLASQGADHDLIEESNEEIIVMRSGCLCCPVRGDLSKTIADLFERRVQNKVAFERIVIETNGIGGLRPDLADVTGGCFSCKKHPNGRRCNSCGCRA